MVSIGKYIQQKRKEKKLTQQDLETLTGLSQKQISRIEKEKNFPQEETLRKILSTLEIEKEEFEKETGVRIEVEPVTVKDLADKLKIIDERTATILDLLHNFKCIC